MADIAKINILTSLFILLLPFTITIFPQDKSINEKGYVPIGGIEQWVTIRGDDSTKPVILFLHGGPGSVMSPYYEAVYGSWESEFVLVNWDQRGAGRTYGRNSPANAKEEYWISHPLKLDQMVQDGIELTEYLTKHLHKKKVILIGTSWGSILGVKMAIARPDLFYAYLGHSQFVNLAENLKHAYNEVLKLAKEAGDEQSVQKLEQLDEPPYSSARNTGQFLRIVKKYERENSEPAPPEWWKVAPEYDNETDSKNRYNSDDYSFLYFAGFAKLGIKSMVENVDFRKDGETFKIPVYLIEGKKDILTSKALNKPYFDAITAPDKGYYLVPGAAHGFNRLVIDTEYRILKEKLVPTKKVK